MTRVKAWVSWSSGKDSTLALHRARCDGEVEVTGLRNPCVQLDRFRPGLMAATLDRDAAGNLVRKAGVMAIVRTTGEVRPNDPIEVVMPATPHRRLRPV